MLWRDGIPRRFGGGPSRVGFRLRRENKALKARAFTGPLRRMGGRGNVRRAEVPRGTPPRRGQASKGEAHGRSGASRAGRDGGVGRDGGSQTPDVARGGSGDLPTATGPPPRDCAVGRESSGEDASGADPSGRPSGAGLPRWTSEGARKRRRGRERLRPSAVWSNEHPKGVETPHGSDGTNVRPGSTGSESLERHETPREGVRSAARRAARSHQPSRL
jgi:hypothetical protein